MTIDPDVHAKARHFGVDASLIQAVVLAEGDIVRAVQKSIPSVATRDEALDILCRSAVHAMSDYLNLSSQSRADFVVFWGDRWAPVGAANDPTELNNNWVNNVRRLWQGVKTA